uniref:Putative ovule protein n=1 Tax=Solanum chacoense TaxID=4108 RepID=A0A0V0GP28_SOLCH
MAQGKYLSSTTLIFLFLISHNFLFIVAEVVQPIVYSPKDKKTYIVYTNSSDYVKILASVLGSEEAAEQAILYTYHHVIRGFSASLTLAQAARLLDHEDVLSVKESATYHLHKGFEGPTSN